MRTLVILFILFGAETSLAFPLHAPQSEASAFFTADFDFEGIVRLSNCSGSLVRLEGATDAEQALVLTNGHCLETGFPLPGQSVHLQASRRRFQLLNSAGHAVGQLQANLILYATMTGTDMALYRLNQTYAEILTRFGVRALMLSSRRPSLATQIEVISGYWERGFRCSIEAFVHQLVEDRYVMTDSIRYSRPGCEVYGGTSGSPIVDTLTREVIGVNNTGNESGQRCTMNNPCEIDKEGQVEFVRGYSYGQQTYQLYSCLTGTRELDLTLPGCALR